ncbi:MAG: TolC family protein, partial [Candidatus Omnitrophica bacterium]|nr:TolC family protein [Candidatus Omnitrophota bacterium]
NRPDYKSAKIGLKNKDIKIQVAKNALLPTIDLSGSLGLNGLGRNYGKALQKVGPDYPDWSMGVKFNIPWGEADRATYDQRQLEKAQALLAFQRMEQNIIFDVRDRVREVNIQARQVEVSKLYQEKEQENFDAQKERYIAGQVSTHDMLDYQDRLSRAQLSYLKALVDYNVAIINLDKSEGLTLVKNNVKLEE